MNITESRHSAQRFAISQATCISSNAWTNGPAGPPYQPLVSSSSSQHLPSRNPLFSTPRRGRDIQPKPCFPLFFRYVIPKSCPEDGQTSRLSVRQLFSSLPWPSFR